MPITSSELLAVCDDNRSLSDMARFVQSGVYIPARPYPNIVNNLSLFIGLHDLVTPLGSFKIR